MSVTVRYKGRVINSVLLVFAALNAVSCTFSSHPRDGTPRDWDFIQAVGGIRLGETYSQYGMTFIPIIADVSGQQSITVPPSLQTVDLVCKIVHRAGGKDIFTLATHKAYISIYTEPKTETTTRMGFSNLCHSPYALPPLHPVISPLIRKIDFYYVEGAFNFTMGGSSEHLIGSIDMPLF